MELNLKKLVNILILLAFIITLLILAKSILVPLAYSVLFSIAILPLVKFFERRGINKIISILISLFVAVITISGVIFIFGYFVSDIYHELPNMSKRVSLGIERFNENVQEISGLTSDKIEEKIKNNIKTVLQPAFSLAKNGIKFSVIAIGNILLILLYMFLLLNYRRGIKDILFQNRRGEAAERRKKIIEESKDIIHSYFYGMFLVMIILGVLNTLSLWAIGVDYPYFWGFLAGTLVIIPYIGTALGGLFPLLYTLAAADEAWKPIAVVVVYAVIQQIEGNFITPKIIGSQINLNMLTIILAMLFGAFIWGIPGIIISVPLVGVLHIIFNNYDEFNKLGKLMSSNLSK